MTAAYDLAAAWESRHPGFRATRPVRLWLASLRGLARALHGVDPGWLTASGVAAAAGAVAVTRPRRANRAAAALVVAGAVADGLDGMLAGTGTPRGRALDHGADRVADVLLVAALARAGAGRNACGAALLGVGALEAGRGRSVRVTPGERPMRVVAGAAGLLARPGLGAGAVAVLTAVSAPVLWSDPRRR